MTFAQILAAQGQELCERHELRPCPFCKGEADIIRQLIKGREKWKDDPDGEAWQYFVVCRGCATQGPWCKSGALGAAQKWNHRCRASSAKLEDYGNWLKAEVAVRVLREENARLRVALREAMDDLSGCILCVDSRRLLERITALKEALNA